MLGLPDSDSILAWVECDALKRTFPVCAGGQVSIGRDERCTLVLPHRKVSRFHANLKAVGHNKIILEDEGSSHGTFVNGKRRTRHMLTVGDVIQSGPFEIGIRAEPNGTWARFDPRRRADTSLLMALGPVSSLTGKIPEVSLSEILQWVEFTQRSCQMIVSDGMQSGRIVFERGRPLAASFGFTRDRAALAAMLTLPEGSFAILREAKPVDRTLDSTVTSLLLDASREFDEVARYGQKTRDLVEELWDSTDSG